MYALTQYTFTQSTDPCRIVASVWSTHVIDYSDKLLLRSAGHVYHLVRRFDLDYVESETRAATYQRIAAYVERDWLSNEQPN